MFFLPVFLIVGFIPLAFGDIVDFNTDKSSYDFNDLHVIISGETTNINPRNFAAIEIIEPNGDWISTPKEYFNENGEFTYSLPTSMLEESGTYTIAATDQMDGQTRFITFEFVNSVPEDIVALDDSNLYNPESELEKENESLKQKITELEAENQSLKEQIDQNLKREFASAKEMVKSYRKQQFDLVDAYVVSLIERTAAIVLQEKLSVKDHARLAERALEEAKSEGVFK